MRAKKVEEFLSVQTDVPKRLRDAIVRMHRGRSPMWKAIGAKRGISQIVSRLPSVAGASATASGTR